MNDLYILINNEERGPFALEDLQRMVESGEIPVETPYAKEGMTAWEQLSTIICAPASGVQSPGTIQPETEISRCEQLFESLQAVCTYAAAREWLDSVAREVKALPTTLELLDEKISAGLQNLDDEKRRFKQQSLLKRAFGSHDSEQAVAQEISMLRQQRNQLVSLVDGMRLKADLVPHSQARRDSLVKEMRHHAKELKAKKKEAIVAMTAIRREARVASDGAGKTWIGFYDPSLAADQRRGIRHAKEDALRPYEDAKESIERQVMALERHLIWLERFE